MTLGYICDQQMLLLVIQFKIQGSPVESHFLCPEPGHPACPLSPLVHHREDNTDLTPNTTPLAS